MYASWHKNLIWTRTSSSFTLGCDCLRTSGVHVTLGQAIDQEICAG